MFPRFCVDFWSICCRCLLGCLSILGPYSVHILCVSLCVITGTSTSLPCASGVVHPQVVPLIVLSHLLNVPLIISWMNLMICDRTCTVSYNTIFISKVDLKTFCLFSIEFLQMLPSFRVDFSSIFCRCFLGFMSIFGPYSVRIRSSFCSYYCASSHEPAQAGCATPEPYIQKWSHLLYHPAYWTSHLLYHDWI